MNGNAPTLQPRKVFTISLEIELGPHKTSKSRLRAAYDAVVESATAIVQEQLLEDSVELIHSTMTYDYRHLVQTETLTEEDLTNGNGHSVVEDVEPDEVDTSPDA